MQLPQDYQIATPGLKFFADFHVQVGAVQEVGASARGFRRVIPIVGGQVRGEGWTAKVLPGGADFQLLVSDELAELDAALRHALQRSDDPLDLGKDDFPLPTLATRLADIERELIDGRGFVRIRGIDRSAYTEVEFG